MSQEWSEAMFILYMYSLIMVANNITAIYTMSWNMHEYCLHEVYVQPTFIFTY